jgi:hypothetical protein
MEKDLKCRKHKYIGKKIESVVYKSNLPIECKFCGKMYFSASPFCIKTIANHTINICSACNHTLKCAGCKSKFNLKKFYIADCIKCGHTEFFCKQCSGKIMQLPIGKKLKHTVLLKMQKILKKFIPEFGNNPPKNLKEFKKLAGFNNIPSYLILHFNVIFPNMFMHSAEEDDADWWKK